MTNMTRRRLIRAGTPASTAGLWLAGTGSGSTHASDDASLREPILVGANPAVQLFDADGNCTAYASCWRVDWSTHGRGTAIVLWRHPGVVDVYGTDASLAEWLADHFVRHFPELNGLPWAAPQHHHSKTHIRIDLAQGMHAESGSIQVRVDGVLDLRTFATDEFQLGEIGHSLSLVLGPCEAGSIQRQGHALPGQIQRSGTPERPGSSAFVTEAEVWKAEP